MIVHNAMIFKWILHALASILCLAVQGMILHRFHFWGVIPFLYPLLAAIPATYESQPASATGYALALGVVCDCLLPDSCPCFYTLLFPVTALCAALLSRLLPAGLLCSYAVSAMAFLFHGVFRCFLLWSGGETVWRDGMFLTLREFVVTAPVLAPLITLLFALLASRTRADELRNG